MTKETRLKEIQRAAVWNELKELSPWQVLVAEELEDGIAAMLDSNPILESLFFDRLLKMLEQFPPDPDFFHEPQMSLFDPLIWVTVSEGHLRVIVKAEYRKLEHVCWVVDTTLEKIKKPGGSLE